MGTRPMRMTVLLILLLLPTKALADEQTCMAQAMYFEARDQGWRGMLAVGTVIQNRVRNSRYPNNVCAVVLQARLSDGQLRRGQCQFTFYCDGKPERPHDKKSWGVARDLADLILEQDLIIVGLEDATHYHATWVRPRWAHALRRCLRVGGHIFYALD